MASSMAISAFLFALALSTVQLSTSIVLQGKISCLDCKPHHDLSGNRILVKCDDMEKYVVAITEEDGHFEAATPSENGGGCLAKLAGGPTQICALRKDMASQITEGSNLEISTISSPLVFSTSCPSPAARADIVFSSKTINLHFPPEWGLAPSSYYLPFIPIIGIP